MSDGAEFAIEDAKDGRRLVLSGNYLVSTIGVADDELRAIEEPISEIDLSGVREIDTVARWLTHVQQLDTPAHSAQALSEVPHDHTPKDR